MSEQSPYAAPVPTPGVYPPPGVQMNPPTGFMPPPPPPGYAPPPPAQAQPAPPAPAQPSNYDSPGMTLTELSFAPLPVEAPPAPAEVAPPPPAGPQLVMDVLPSGGIARGIFVGGGGRTPLIALVLVLLLAGAGVFFGTGLFKSEDKPAPPPVKKTAKAPVEPLVGRTITIDKKSSGTLGGAYTMTVPNGWTAKQKLKVGGQSTDVQISHPSGQTIAIRSMDAKGEPDGQPSAADLEVVKQSILASVKDGKALPGSVNTKVAGIAAIGFDYSQVTNSGENASLRAVMFARDGTGYAVLWGAESSEFTKSLKTFDRFLASVKFA